MDDQYRVPEDFRYFDKFVEDLRYLARLLLSILPQSNHKILMIMFFIARGDACLHGIYLLCKENSFSNARILQRTLIDLIVHMKHVLVDNDLVDEFRDYTIKEKCRFADYMLMTAKDRGEVDAETEQYAKKFQKMYREVLRERGKPVWIRPKAEEVLAGDEYARMYRYGWDFPSGSVVHPLFNTGEIDLMLLTGDMDSEDVKPSCEIMNNAIDAQIHLISMGVALYGNQPTARLPKDCLLDMLESLRNQSYDYEDRLLYFAQAVIARRRD